LFYIYRTKEKKRPVKILKRGRGGWLGGGGGGGGGGV